MGEKEHSRGGPPLHSERDCHSAPDSQEDWEAIAQAR
jgi:hypothetical protein